ncbi:MAG: hypothetical protein U0974_15810 [Gemmatimonadales bacterium]|nr:hypothetical protein [Gemmatimonadales bacterium]
MKVFDLTGQFPEAIGVAPDDSTAMQWATVVRGKTRGRPSVHFNHDLTPGTASLYFVGTDGQLMLTTETLRSKRRDAVSFQGLDEVPAWGGAPALP